MNNKNFISLTLIGAMALGMTGCWLDGSSRSEVDFTKVYPEPPEGVQEDLFTAAIAASAGDIAPIECENCLSFATDSVHQTSQQTHYIEGVEAVTSASADFRMSFLVESYANEFFDLGDDEKFVYYDNDYYHDRKADGTTTNEVYVQRVPAGTDWLYAGMWVYSRAAAAEVVSFADATGTPIAGNAIEGITGTATYGDTDDNSPEGTGYYFDGEETTVFFADMVLTANFGTDSQLGSVDGVLSNEDYHGPIFEATFTQGITDSDGGFFTPSLTGTAGGAVIDETWGGFGSVKFFGGDGTAHPDFAYGTFGLVGSSAGSQSLLGAFIAPLQ